MGGTSPPWMVHLAWMVHLRLGPAHSDLSAFTCLPWNDLKQNKNEVNFQPTIGKYHILSTELSTSFRKSFFAWHFIATDKRGYPHNFFLISS